MRFVTGNSAFLALAAALALTVTMAGSAAAFSSGPPDGFAGNPPIGFDCTLCHSDFPVNSGNGSLALLGLPAGFVPGATYDLTVELADPDQMRWGFQVTVLGPDPLEAGGVLTVTDTDHTQLSDNPDPDPDYLSQKSEGTYAGIPDGPVSWSFQWTAPDLPYVTFYLAGNAANGTGDTDGDYIYTTSAELTQSATATEGTTWGNIKALYR